MGYMVELNTLLGLPKDFDAATLTVGQQYTILKDRERAFPLHVAILIVDSEWNFMAMRLRTKLKLWINKQRSLLKY